MLMALAKGTAVITQHWPPLNYHIETSFVSVSTSNSTQFSSLTPIESYRIRSRKSITHASWLTMVHIQEFLFLLLIDLRLR